jgi:hypothetical protein
MTDEIRVVVPLPFGDIAVFESLICDLRSRNRFTPSSAATHFVTELISDANRLHVSALQASQVFHRARRHPINWDRLRFDPFSQEEMMAPPPEKATGGRLNPEGIPYLYVATDEATAIAEVRPWKAAVVSVARLRLAKDLRVADFCLSELPSSATTADREKGAELTWNMVGGAFAIPHHPGDNLRYLPTQYLAEAFKAAGFDGIRYDSALSASGQNVALFDCAAASVEGVRQIKVTGIRYEYQ